MTKLRPLELVWSAVKVLAIGVGVTLLTLALVALGFVLFFLVLLLLGARL